MYNLKILLASMALVLVLAAPVQAQVVGWGENNYGQATPPSGLGVVQAIGAGYFHNLAVRTDGTVVGWGLNNSGQATPPAGLSGVYAISAGGNHSLALKTDGTVVGWGLNGYGQATPPAGLARVQAIAAGGFHSLALKSDGTVVGWGENTYGAAAPPAGLTGVKAIAAGYEYSLALKTDGTVVGWGDNHYGQAAPPAGLPAVARISAGGYHSLALTCGGTVVGWGDNFYGEATPPASLAHVKDIKAGSYHSLALEDPVCGPPFEPIVWTFTDEGFIAGGQNGAFRIYTDPTMVASSPWTVSSDALTLRISYENDCNCAGYNCYTQSGTARAMVFAALCSTARMNIGWTGLGERQLPDYEKMSLFVDGVQVAYAHAPGGNLGCPGGVGPVVSVPAPPEYFDLPIGLHELLIQATTQDDKFHIGAYYQFAINFQLLP